MENSKNQVRIFSTPSCVYCVTLKSFLEEHNVEFEEIDVSQNEEVQKEMIEKSGQMGVPVVEINGQMVVGFDKPRIVELLKIKD